MSLAFFDSRERLAKGSRCVSNRWGLDVRPVCAAGALPVRCARIDSLRKEGGPPVCGSLVGNLQKAQELRIVLIVGQIGGRWVLRVLECQESRIFYVFYTFICFSLFFSVSFSTKFRPGGSRVKCLARNPGIQKFRPGPE